MRMKTGVVWVLFAASACTTIEQSAADGGVLLNADSGQSAIDGGQIDSGMTEVESDAGLEGVVLAMGQNDPVGIVADSNAIYWANRGAGTIMKLALSGGTPTTLANAQGEPASLTIDSVNLYWVNQENNALVKLPLTGGTATPIVTAGAPVFQLIVNDGFLYWAEHFSALKRVSVSGGTPQTLASGNVHEAIAVAEGFVYFAISEPAETVLRRVAVTGGMTQVLAPASQQRPGIAAIASDGVNVYWAIPIKGAIVAKSLLGGDQYDLAVEPDDAEQLRVENGRCYWSTAEGEAIRSISVEGGVAQDVAKVMPGSVRRFVVAGSWLYWTSDDGVIRKVKAIAPTK